MAPYELLIRTRWENFANVFFLAAAVISAGAMAVSAFCGYAAVAGLESRTTFHRPGRRFTHSTRAPVVPLRTKEYSVESIAALEVVTHDWSDGPSSYSFEVVLMDGRRLNLGSSWSKAEAEEVRDRAAEYLHPSS